MRHLPNVIVVIIGICLLSSGCRDTHPPTGATSTVPDKPPAAISDVAAGGFELLPAARTGLAFQNDVDPAHRMRRLYHSGFVCGGVAIGDVDGDGRPDIYLVSGAGSNKLYRNLGDFKFADVTAQSGVDGRDRWGTGAVMIDIDNDGDLDIYVCNYDDPNLLYINQGDGRFDEQAGRWNLDVVDASLMATFSDYDRDGDLDIYLLNNRYYRAGGRPPRPPWIFRDGQPHVLPEFQKYYTLTEKTPGNFNMDDYGRPDRFFRNNGDGSFSEITEAAGIKGHGYGLSATWWDYNSDGWLDIYVCNDFNDPDRLYRNNGDGTFTDVLAETLPHTSWFSMGSDTGDINNDGLFDFFCVDMSATNHFKQKTTMGVMNAAKLAEVAGPPPQYMRNTLFLNSGAGRCWEIAYMAGLADTDWSWAAKLADLDNDGWLDVFVSNGMIRNFNDSDVPFELPMLIGNTRWDLYQHLPTRPEQNLAFRNRGDLDFEDVSKSWRLDHVGMSYATAMADLDGDQDLDMIVVNVDEPVSVYRNRLGGNRVTVSLKGQDSNRFGVGAQLRLETPDATQVRQMMPVTGFLACNEPMVHFGMGSHDHARLTIHWPSGKRQVVEKLMANRAHVFDEQDAESVVAPDRTVTPLFTRGNSLDEYAHRESEFDDFKLQPLLPNKMSQLGPGMAWADVDGDGDEDVYLGGASGQPGALLINEGDQFQPRNIPAFAADARHEDMGSVFIDADSDGDQDLYVVSGGVERASEADQLQDRLYLNDGDGTFHRSPADRLPTIAASGSVVSAADVDQDGDLDLFIGGRLIPGQYPLPPRSFLLRNDAGRFVDATDQLAPELKRTGLVTGAVWSDVNDDGWCDLMVTHEWGPIKCFLNANGTLKDYTEQAGLSRRTGWWNGITGRDIDGDRDIDFIATNAGLNTKYHASLKKPALLFYGDFENTGRLRLVEAEFEDETLYPIRGKSCSTNAMPFLGQRYQTFRDFALADLADIYTEQCLDGAHRFEASTLQSGAFLNDGSGRFEFRPLPRLAQASPAFGVALDEINGDGNPDVYVVQNFFGPQPETGHMDGGLSLLLFGEGDGSFQPVWPTRSGLVVPGDAKSLARTDLDADGVIDFVVGLNNDRPICFTRGPVDSNRLVTVRLRGGSGNLTCVGARVTVVFANGTSQTAEVYAGEGYLSQSTSTLSFGMGDAQIKRIEVTWPDAQRTQFNVDASQRHFTIEPPGNRPRPPSGSPYP